MIDNKEEQKEIFNPHSIVVATSTLYPGWRRASNPDTSIGVRGNLALEAIKTGVDLGYQFLIVDGGSSQEFIDEAGHLGASVLPQQEDGMSPGRRQVFDKSAHLPNCKVICWTEPEKVDFIKNCLSEAVTPILTNEADIVIPKRDETSYSTYPDYQVKYEKRANALWNKILRTHNILPEGSEDLDMWFGPRVFKNDSEIVKLFLEKHELSNQKIDYFKDVNPEDYSNATYLPIILALDKGFRVISVTVPYRHPAEQTNLEIQNEDKFKKKRMWQLKTIITVTAEFIRYLEQNPKTKII